MQGRERFLVNPLDPLDPALYMAVFAHILLSCCSLSSVLFPLLSCSRISHATPSGVAKSMGCSLNRLPYVGLNPRLNSSQVNTDAWMWTCTLAQLGHHRFVSTGSFSMLTFHATSVRHGVKVVAVFIPISFHPEHEDIKLRALTARSPRTFFPHLAHRCCLGCFREDGGSFIYTIDI